MALLCSPRLEGMHGSECTGTHHIENTTEIPAGEFPSMALMQPVSTTTSRSAVSPIPPPLGIQVALMILQSGYGVDRLSQDPWGSPDSGLVRKTRMAIDQALRNSASRGLSVTSL